jgi:hypothetical protein
MLAAWNLVINCYVEHSMRSRLLCALVLSLTFALNASGEEKFEGPPSLVVRRNQQPQPFVTVINGAEQPSAMSFPSVAVGYFRELLERASREDPFTLFHSDLGLEKSRAEMVLYYIKYAVQNLAAYENALSSQMCADADRLTTVKSVAEAMKLAEAKIEARKSELVRESESAMGQGAKFVFDLQVERRIRKTTTQKVDYEKYITLTGTDPKALVAKSCKVRNR